MIHLKHVSVRRGGKHILDDLSLELEPGEHCAIIGPNGAGKSTLVQVITKEVHPLQHPDMEMSLYGKKRWHISDLRSRLGIVSHSMERFCRTSYSAYEIVASGFLSSIGIPDHKQPTEEMKQKAFELLEFMGVSHLRDKQMNRLSSGEARRVLIARALAHDPETLILDEPTSNLDMKTQSLFKQTLRDIAASGKSLILVTHDLSDIIPEIQKVVILKDGKLFKQGTKEKLLNEKILSEVYDTHVYVDQHDHWYKAWC
jgi:iron complex transport system ATP-binding protein